MGHGLGRRGQCVRARTKADVAQALALVAAAAAALVVLVVPMYSSVTQHPDGRMETSTKGFVDVNGPWAIAVLLIPVVLAGVPLLPRGRTKRPAAMVATVLLCIFVFLTGFTIGLFFLPAAVCAVVALALPARTRRGRDEDRRHAA